LQAFWHSQAGRRNNENLVKAMKQNKNYEQQIGTRIAVKSMEKLGIISKSKEKQCFASILALTGRSLEQ